MALSHTKRFSVLLPWRILIERAADPLSNRAGGVHFRGAVKGLPDVSNPPFPTWDCP